MGNGTQLGKVRGLGSAKSGTHHWLTQRTSAIANLALLVWLITSFLTNDVTRLDAVQRWLTSPYAAVPLALLAISAFTHMRLGLTVLIEDYVHDDALKLISLTALTFYSWGGMIFALFAIARIALGGGHGG